MSGRPRILVIDDDPDIQFLLKHRLESLGYEPVAATDGEEGLRIAEAQRPDLIILDIMMPKMKGREVCAQLKANPNTQQIPVIFLSALRLPEHIQTGMNLGAEDYLTKPFAALELKRRISVCLARHSAPSQPS